MWKKTIVSAFDSNNIAILDRFLPLFLIHFPRFFKNIYSIIISVPVFLICHSLKVGKCFLNNLLSVSFSHNWLKYILDSGPCIWYYWFYFPHNLQCCDLKRPPTQHWRWFRSVYHICVLFLYLLQLMLRETNFFFLMINLCTHFMQNNTQMPTNAGIRD